MGAGATHLGYTASASFCVIVHCCRLLSSIAGCCDHSSFTASLASLAVVVVELTGGSGWLVQVGAGWL